MLLVAFSSEYVADRAQLTFGFMSSLGLTITFMATREHHIERHHFGKLS